MQFAKQKPITYKNMSKETGILLAGGMGLLLGLGLFGIRKLMQYREREYDDYYNDYHRHFVSIPRNDAPEGIEFMAVR